MGPFLVALLICAFIALYAAAGLNSISARDWLLTGIPAWLQGLGTVGASYVAWRAYSTWREQDAGRRRAAAAERVVLAAHNLADTILRVRIPHDIFREVIPEVLMEMANADKESREAVTVAAQRLRAELTMAAHYRFPQDGHSNAVGARLVAAVSPTLRAHGTPTEH